jgi:prepilin-type N-terminal cleavage/methylation domain-containing protein
MITQPGQKSSTRIGGFSLLELMVTMAILTIVIGVVTQGLNTMQVRNTVETNKVDLTQESRQFMDQIINDIHQSGFPRISLFDAAALVSGNDCTKYTYVACGIINLDSKSITFQGDVDGTGVSVVTIQLIVPNTGCPCIIQRGTVLKSVGGTPPYYTEVNNVMNQNVFSAYQNDGTSVALPITNVYSSGLNVDAIGVNLYVRSSQPDAKTGIYPSVTMASTVKVNN